MCWDTGVPLRILSEAGKLSLSVFFKIGSIVYSLQDKGAPNDNEEAGSEGRREPLMIMVMMVL